MYRIQVRVIPAASNDLQCIQNTVSDSVVTDNRITKRTSCDELWALLDVRNVLIRELIALSTEWVTACQMGNFTVATMPRMRFPQLSQEDLHEFKKMMHSMHSDPTRTDWCYHLYTGLQFPKDVCAPEHARDSGVKLYRTPVRSL
jgi:hypothetical protein